MENRCARVNAFASSTYWICQPRHSVNRSHDIATDHQCAQLAQRTVCSAALRAEVDALHGTLNERLEPRPLEIWEMAARYQLLHAVVIVCASILAARTAPAASAAGWFFVIGTVVFSGSL